MKNSNLGIKRSRVNRTSETSYPLKTSSASQTPFSTKLAANLSTNLTSSFSASSASRAPFSTKISAKLSAILSTVISIVLLLAGVLALGACSNPDSGSNANLDTSSNYSVNTNSDSSKTQTTIVNVASRYDSVEVWDAVNKLLEADNIKVVNKAYDAAVNLNDLLIAGDVDLNVAQHYAAIDYFKSADKKYDVLVPLGDIHISTIDLYSNKYKDVNELPNGANIAIPNDAMNGGRALMVLAKADLITLDSNYVGFPDETNITANPKNFHFVKIDSSSMIRVLDDVDAGFAYSLNAVDANLNPIIDPILNDKLDLQNDATQKQFVIVFTGVNGDEKNEVYQKVVKAFHNDEVYKVYKEVYKGGNIPVADGKPIDLSKF